MGWRATREDAFRDPGMQSMGLSFSSSPPQPPPPPHPTPVSALLNGGCSPGGLGGRDSRAATALCVCLSVGDCIRRCSSIMDRAVVCSVVLVWEQEGGELGGGGGGGQASLQERYKDWSRAWR